MSQSSLRHTLRRARRSISPEAAAVAAGDAGTRVAALASAMGWSSVGAYIAVDGELDPGPALATLRATGLTVALPRVDGDDLVFCAVAADDRLTRGAFGIPGPADHAPPTGPLDAVLIPLVGFDDQGSRLGMGAGFYDRYLGLVPGTVRVGLAHDRQRVPRLGRRSWDRPLDHVVTGTMALSPTLVGR